jgi:hypothetical protein
MFCMTLRMRYSKSEWDGGQEKTNLKWPGSFFQFLSAFSHKKFYNKNGLSNCEKYNFRKRKISCWRQVMCLENVSAWVSPYTVQGVQKSMRVLERLNNEKNKGCRNGIRAKFNVSTKKCIFKGFFAAEKVKMLPLKYLAWYSWKLVKLANRSGGIRNFVLSHWASREKNS